MMCNFRFHECFKWDFVLVIKMNLFDLVSVSVCVCVICLAL